LQEYRNAEETRGIAAKIIMGLHNISTFIMKLSGRRTKEV
jgi:hypothetical protein